MTELHDLVKAVVNNPQEHTPVAMLADFLTERGDGRGEILSRWLTDADKRTSGGLDQVASVHVPHDDGYGLVRAVYGNPDPVFTTTFHTHVETPSGLKVRKHSDSYSLFVPHADARHIADQLPEPKEVHEFLDKHFGPDPRFNKQLNDALTPSE